jgi:LEA14-like dessication related protein
MKKRRPVLWITLAMVLIFCIGYIIYAVRSFQKIPDKTFILPKMDSAVVRVTELTKEKTTLEMHLLMNNPLPFKLSADSVAYEFFISDTAVMKTSYRENISLKAADTTWMFMPVIIENQKLVSILDLSEKRGFDSVYYEVKASFYSHLLKEKKFDFHFGRMLPLLHIPEVALGKVEIDSLNLKRMKLLVHTTIKNENVFAIKADKVSYRFSVAGNKWITGRMPEMIDLEKQSTTEVIFPVRVSLEEVGETVFTLLKKGKKVPYGFEMELTTVSEKNALDGSRVIVTNAGTIGEIVQLAKDASKKKHHSGD